MSPAQCVATKAVKTTGRTSSVFRCSHKQDDDAKDLQNLDSSQRMRSKLHSTIEMQKEICSGIGGGQQKIRV